MSVSNITRSRLFNLFLKSVYSKRTTCLIRNDKYRIRRILSYISHSSKYFCFAFLNSICFAYAEEDVSQKQNSWDKGVVDQADELFQVGKFQDSLKTLEPFKDSQNVEILWRISRALYNMSKTKGMGNLESAEIINEAFQYIEKALELDGNHYAVHKWMAILYDAKCALEGIKARIHGLPVFKEHLMTAIELNPKDATTIYMLGQYMYNIADMSWLQKTIAKTLFGSAPVATFEEAFYYFSRAEEVDPNFYSANLLMLGKTCLKLKKIEAACYWLKCATSYPVRTDEDEAVRLEAEELLHKYSGVKPYSKEEMAHKPS